MVDIIIPTYNRKDFLKEAILSIQNQSFQDWKIYIIDDCSSDNTFEEVNAFYSEEISSKKINIFRLEENRGVSYARNYGIKHSRSPWLAFLDSDDKWLPKKLEKQMEFSKKNPEIPLIHCNEIWLKNGKILNQKKRHEKKGGRIFKDCIPLCCISPSATLIKRSVFEKLGLFREDFPVCEDYELWLRITSHFEVGFLKENLILKFGGHFDQLSKKYSAMDYWRIKALYLYLNSEAISKEERNLLYETLIFKSKILIQGYKKRNFLDKEKEILKILEKAKKIFLSYK